MSVRGKDWAQGENWASQEMEMLRRDQRNADERQAAVIRAGLAPLTAALIEVAKAIRAAAPKPTGYGAPGKDEPSP